MWIFLRLKKEGKKMKKQFYKKLLFIALPIMIQYFITSSLNLVDSLMIGSLGEDAIAALGISNQYFFLFNLILLGTYAGIGVLISQFWGQKDYKSIKKSLGIGLLIGTAISIVFLFGAQIFTDAIVKLFNKDVNVLNLSKQYLKIVSFSYPIMGISMAFGMSSRSVGKAVMPMVCSGFSIFVNIFFNYGFIFGNLNMPKLGVSGAAIATLIARIIEMILILMFVYIFENPLKSKFKELKDFDSKFFNEAMKTVVPVIINELCWGLGMVIYSMIYGNTGKEALASVQICMTIQNIFMVVLFGVANAASVVTGHSVGAKDFNLCKLQAKEFIKLSFMLGVFMAIMLFLSSSTILTYYKISSKVHNSALMILYMSAIILPFRFINVLLIVGILRGAGDASNALKIELFTMWFIGVPACFIGAFVLHLSVEYVYALVMLEEVGKFIASMIRYKSNKWIKIVKSEKTA